MAAEGFVASGAIPWLAFFSFSVAPGCSVTLEGLSEEVKTSTRLSLLASATLGAVLVLKLLGLDARMARG